MPGGWGVAGEEGEYIMKKLFAALPLLALCACAKPYAGVPYAAPAAPMTSVGLVDDSLPEEVVAYEAASTMSNFGLIGALIDAGVQASRKDRVNDALEGIGYKPEETFETYLGQAMARNGVQTMVIESGTREKRKFLPKYPAAPAGVQALVDVNVVGFGYSNAGNQMWRPTVLADVRMVNAATGKTMMENRIAYNVVDSQAGVVTIAPNSEFAFQNREDMVTQPERLAAGLDDALRQVADAAVRLMR